jgi:transcriptional regulator with XRE-family HTH domain
MNSFVNWFNQQIEAKGWTYADIAKRGVISKSMVSRVVSEQSQPGLEFCKAVARAFEIPADFVLRRAGLIDPLPPAVEEEQEILHIVRSLSPERRIAALDMLRGLVGRSSGAQLTAMRNDPASIAEPAPGAVPARETEQVFYEEGRPADDEHLDTRDVLVQLFNTVAHTATAEDLQWAAEWFRRAQEDDSVENT